MVKKLVIVLLTVVMMVIPSSVVMAQNNITDIGYYSQNDNNIPSFRADVIVTKFRNYAGKLQYRRWNNTRGYWVDSYWIYM